MKIIAENNRFGFKVDEKLRITIEENKYISFLDFAYFQHHFLDFYIQMRVCIWNKKKKNITPRFVQNLKKQNHFQIIYMFETHAIKNASMIMKIN